MPPEIIFPGEDFATLLALVIPDSFVAHYVIVQDELACEGFPTQRASMRRFRFLDMSRVEAYCQVADLWVERAGMSVVQ